MNLTRKYILGTVAFLTLLGAMVAMPAFADTTSSTQNGNGQVNGRGGGWGDKGPRQEGTMNRPVIVGEVSAINGTTLTVLGFSMEKPTSSTDSTATRMARATTTYSVYAGSATVMKNRATSTLASVVTGDKISVEGTLSGTTVTATVIHDGVFMGRPGDMGNRGGNQNGERGRMGSTTPATPVITGNGQPVIAGTISAISGSTITVTNKSNVEYSVDASSAKIAQGSNVVTLSNLSTGDSVVVQGTVNGNSVVASSIVDHEAKSNTSNASNGDNHPGFFAGVGQFFMKMFGF